MSNISSCCAINVDVFLRKKKESEKRKRERNKRTKREEVREQRDDPY